MRFFKDASIKIIRAGKDEEFLSLFKKIESFVSKILSLAMIVVIAIAVIDLLVILGKEIFIDRSIGQFNSFLVRIFGVFLNVLIALEILENITAYLRKHVIQVELVIITSLIAVARKIIIIDFEKTDGIELIGLAIAIFALSISYWIVRHVNAKNQDK